jgi:hypothetical protein
VNDVIDALEAFDGYMLYITIIIAMILFRAQAARLIAAFSRRIRRGDSLSMLGVELGGSSLLVESTDDAQRAAKAKGEELQVFGNPDRFQLLFKAQGSRWKKSTKAMVVPGGCLVLVTSERQSIDGEWTTAESLQLVPGADLVKDEATGVFDLVPVA